MPPLTREAIRLMSPEAINARWAEVSAVLSGSEPAAEPKTLDDVRAMKAQDINTNWEAVARILSGKPAPGDDLTGLTDDELAPLAADDALAEAVIAELTRRVEARLEAVKQAATRGGITQPAEGVGR